MFRLSVDVRVSSVSHERFRVRSLQFQHEVFDKMFEIETVRRLNCKVENRDLILDLPKNRPSRRNRSNVDFE